jgi:hypothetical protein
MERAEHASLMNHTAGQGLVEGSIPHRRRYRVEIHNLTNDSLVRHSRPHIYDWVPIRVSCPGGQASSEQAGQVRLSVCVFVCHVPQRGQQPQLGKLLIIFRKVAILTRIMRCKGTNSSACVNVSTVRTCLRFGSSLDKGSSLGKKFSDQLEK